jgi:hypothetical protein
VEDDSGKEIHPGPEKAKTPPDADKDTRERCHLENVHDFSTCACEYKPPDNLAEALHPGADAPKMTLAGGAVRFKYEDEDTHQDKVERIVLTSERRRPNWDPHAPFIVARAVPDIISQHSDIYTPRFVTFLTAYIKQFLEAAKNLPPESANDPCAATMASK